MPLSETPCLVDGGCWQGYGKGAVQEQGPRGTADSCGAADQLVMRFVVCAVWWHTLGVDLHALGTHLERTL